MAANNPTISDGDALGLGGRGPAGAGLQARQPRIQAAMPLEAKSAAPSPARSAPSQIATRRCAS
jgi:hypothetical protein